MIGLYLVFISIIYLSPYLLGNIWTNYLLYYGSNTLIVRVLGPWLLSIIVYWSCGVFWLIVDYYQMTIFSKLQPTSKNRISIDKCIKVVIFNQIMILLPTIYILDHYTHIDFSLELPDSLTIFKQLILVFLTGEVFYYYVHRLLHTSVFYKYIHKMHHEYITPIGIAALYCHPIEMLFGNTLTLVGPLYLFNVHGYTLYLGIILGFFESVADHSGYNIKGNFHDKHHELYNVNYGSMGFLDKIHNTE